MKYLFSVSLCIGMIIYALGLQTDPLWEYYKKQFKKHYDSNEETHRREIWKKKIAEIVRHNIEADLGFHTYRKGLNEYSDLDFNEHINLLMGYRVSKYNNSGPYWIPPIPWTPLSDISLPDEKDWRREGYVTPIKNQKSCGSCWAFSATGSLEGQHKKKTGELISLSEQNLIDCSTENDGCNGGSVDGAFTYIERNNGIDTEESYPYEAKNGTCRFKRPNVGATINGHIDLPVGDENALKQAVATIGPISAIIDGCHNSFTNYKSGIFDEPKCRTDIPSHAILVVGYGTEDGKDYWLIKNSWGESWGMKGYMKMSRNKNNQCGIASRATYPLV